MVIEKAILEKNENDTVHWEQSKFYSLRDKAFYMGFHRKLC